MNSARLVVITANYPYRHTGGEVMFVAPEMDRLAREFKKLTIFPLHASGERLVVPPGVEVDTSLARMMRRTRLGAHLGAISSSGFWPEMGRALRQGGWIGMARVWRWAAAAHVTARWIRAAAFPDATPLLLYTYWRGGSTLALARAAETRPLTGVVTRVHRYELYEHAFDPPFQPWHPALYGRLMMTATISQHGLDYLLAAGVDPSRLGLYRLGTERLKCRAAASVDGGIRLVSCSHVSSVKRVPLIAEAVTALAARHLDRHFYWTHFGDGPELDRVFAIGKAATSNLEVRLRGHVDNELVRKHYECEPVDGFVLLSKSEGLPVSIQEAASAGVPVVATDVGGVRELVGEDNGVLLPANCGVDLVVAALERVLLDRDATRRQARRNASWRRWSEGFDAEVNHTRYARRLRDMLDSLGQASNLSLTKVWRSSEV